MIVLKKVCKSYVQGNNVTNVLQNVSLTIEHGEFISIMGPSGSGKSTLMHILGLLDNPSSGMYSLLGTPVTQLNEGQLAVIRNREIGFVFQAFHLLPRLSAVDNVELPLVYAGVPRQERRLRALACLERMGLLDHASKRPSELSGGQKQRVAIARALVTKPSLLLADEPTGALDSNTSYEIMEVFQSLHYEGNTIVLITHDQEISKYASRQLLVRDGLLIEGGKE